MKSIILLSNLNYQKFPSSTPSENDEVPQIWIPILFSATTYNISFFSSTHTAKQWKNTAFPKWLWWIFDYIVPTILLSYLSHSNSRAYLLRPIVAIAKQYLSTLRKKIFVASCATILLLCSTASSADLQKNTFIPQNMNSISFDSLHQAYHLGPLPSPTNILIVLIFSIMANYFLTLWWIIRKSRGKQSYVNATVHDSIGRSLTLRECCCFACIAVVNAVCEELISRGFFMYELLHIGQTSKLQAFGI